MVTAPRSRMYMGAHSADGFTGELSGLAMGLLGVLQNLDRFSGASFVIVCDTKVGGCLMEGRYDTEKDPLLVDVVQAWYNCVRVKRCIVWEHPKTM